MTDKLNQEIKIKAKQVTEDLINFMQELDTENNHQIKELQIDIEYYKSRIEELESENEQAKKIIREYSKWECEYCDYKRNPNYVTEHCSQCQKYSLHKKAEAFINKE